MTRKRVLLAAGAAILLAVGINATTAVWPVTTIAEGRVGPTVPGVVVPPPTTLPTTPTTFAVIGDSISARASRAGLDMSGGSWTTYASQGGAEFVAEGWAQSGAKLLEMTTNAAPVTADVLVVLAGTNDLDGVLTIENRLGLVTEIVEKAGAERVILSAVPPLDRDPAASTAWNAALQKLAADNAWRFVDPWQTMRTPEGTYAPSYTPDGIHPSVQAAAIAGEALRVAIVAIPSMEA
ncbi:SGNH/GDSL hydrolase family protein [Conyzicola sp.]|uniref:SGNH/GDSL hydrolase family protein n=1 Tax=Conyzicola sp. TaxID=1969404 RepID=UPI0039894831